MGVTVSRSNSIDLFSVSRECSADRRRNTPLEKESGLELNATATMAVFLRCLDL